MNKTDMILVAKALVYAVQDREGLAGATGLDDEAGVEAYKLAQDFRALHKRLTGQEYLTPFEEDIANSTEVSVFDIVSKGDHKEPS